jgi:Glycosyl transferase family 2
MNSVRRHTQRKIPQHGVLCMALAHNEAARLRDFLRHHRQLGVVHFLILDDHSGDGTLEMLSAQDDVTVFAPNGTNYRDHKIAWRREILDNYAEGRWVLVPDMDELFVFPHSDSARLDAFIAHLGREGAQAVFAPMVEMYADAPLDSPVYQPGASMLAAFPFFDSEGYRLVGRKRKHTRHHPVPALDMHGGPRERLFYDFCPEALSAPRRWAVQRFAHLQRPMHAGLGARAANLLARLALSGKAPRPPLVMSKIALLKWRQGLTFPGGPHAVSEPLPLSANWGALLHFKFLDLPGQAAYSATRGQHAKGAVHYQTIEARGGYHRSPIYAGSRRYTNWRDLLGCGLLRCSPEWTAENSGLTRDAEDLRQAG